MEENNNQNANTEEVKKETTDKAKGFVSNLFKNPIDQIEKIATSPKNQFLKVAIIVLVIWLVIIFVNSVINVLQSYSIVSSLYTNFGTFLRNSVSNIFSVIKSVATPILSVVILSGIIYIMAKNKKKPFVQIITSVVIAKIPVVISTIAGLFEILGDQVYKIVNPFSGFCNILSTILIYFTIRALYEEKDDNHFIKTFAIIMGIFYIVKFVISFFGISI